MSIAAAHARRNRPDRIRPDAAGNDNESLFLLHGWIVLAVLRRALRARASLHPAQR
jgi:hypothetical protein